MLPEFVRPSQRVVQLYVPVGIPLITPVLVMVIVFPATDAVMGAWPPVRVTLKVTEPLFELTEVFMAVMAGSGSGGEYGCAGAGRSAGSGWVSGGMGAGGAGAAGACSTVVVGASGSSAVGVGVGAGVVDGISEGSKRVLGLGDSGVDISGVLVGYGSDLTGLICRAMVATVTAMMLARMTLIRATLLRRCVFLVTFSTSLVVPSGWICRW